MADPVTLATLGASALSKGIDFLYDQAGELLKRRRERKDDAEALVPMRSEALDGALREVRCNWTLVDALAEEIARLRGELAVYAVGGRSAQTGDEELVGAAQALRGALELALGQRITLAGERRAPSGSEIEVEAEADRVAGELMGIDAATLPLGLSAKVQHTIGEVAEGGSVVGVKIGG